MSDPGDLPDSARKILAGAQLLALDVDGCLTDGRVVLGPHGEIQAFCVHDGQGLRWLQREGVVVAWITGRGCEATRMRARELGVEEVHLQAGPKEDVLRSIQSRLSIPSARTIAMGDDLPDLGLARASAFFVAPADARKDVRRAADLVTDAGGGRGAVRELCEHVLRSKGRWQNLLDAAAR